MRVNMHESLDSLDDIVEKKDGYTSTARSIFYVSDLYICAKSYSRWLHKTRDYDVVCKKSNIHGLAYDALYKHKDFILLTESMCRHMSDKVLEHENKYIFFARVQNRTLFMITVEKDTI